MTIDPIMLAALKAGTVRALSKAGASARSALDQNAALARATAEAENEIVWTGWVVLAEVVRSLHPEMSRVQAFELMMRIAREPEVQPRFVAMMTNARRSGTTGRIAMLAAAFFGGAKTAEMRARVDLAIGSLFEEDADSLAKIIDHCRSVQEPALVMNPEAQKHDVLLLGELAAGHLVPFRGTAIGIGRASVAALENACCIRRDQRRDTGLGAAWPLVLQPVGEALAAALESVAWKDIAKVAVAARQV